MMAVKLLKSTSFEFSIRAYHTRNLMMAQPIISRFEVHSADGPVLLRNYRFLLSRSQRRLQVERREYSQKVLQTERYLVWMERLKRFWKGPTFKYWFVGVSAFSSWIAYYSIKSYKSTRINVILPMALPNHYLINRKHDVSSIFEVLGSSHRVGGKLQCLLINGPTGSGKSILAHFVARELMRKIDWNPIGLPKSHTSVYLCGDTLKAFLISLQAFAAELKIRPVDIKKKIEEYGEALNTRGQCRALLDLIKEKLEKHPNWVIVIDNLQRGSSEDIIAIVDELIMDRASSWSKGSLILTTDGLYPRRFDGVSSYPLKPRLSESDAIQLLKNVANVKDEFFEASSAAHVLLSKISFHPMATICAGILLKDSLKKEETKSIDGAIMELVKSVASNALAVQNDSCVHPELGVSESLIVAETVIAMTTKMLLSKNPYVSASFDLISACAPRTPLPAMLIARYLRHPSLKLPALERPVSPQSNLQQMFKDTSMDKKDENLDPKGKVWSIKSITEYITNIENWFQQTWQMMREVYNLYYGEILDHSVDNSIQALQDCELLMSSKLQPGDVQSYSMHPLIYAVARQYFLSNSVSELENAFLKEDETQFNRQAWFKKLSNYEPRSNLIRYRNEHAKMVVNSQDSSSLVNSYNNDLINVSSLLRNPKLDFEESNFRFIGCSDKVKYLQSHLDRIIQSLGTEMRLSKQTVPGKTIMKYLDIHGDYIHSSFPVEMISVKGKITCKIVSAKKASDIDGDSDKAMSELQDALQVMKDNDPENYLEIANLLCQLAALSNSKEEHENGVKYLENAVDLYESQRRRDGEYKQPLEFGKALGALGVIKGTLGDRTKSKELIERGLMLQQTGAPNLADESQSKHFGGEFASALIDLGHAYVSLGMPLYGRKILDLALMAHRNIHGEKHPEVVRAITVLSIAHLMQGHNEESRRLRREAGKIQSQIDKLPLY